VRGRGCGQEVGLRRCAHGRGGGGGGGGHEAAPLRPMRRKRRSAARGAAAQHDGGGGGEGPWVLRRSGVAGQASGGLADADR